MSQHRLWCSTLAGGLEEGTAVAMEATGSYHLLLADACVASGRVAYVLNPKDVARYKSAVSPRGKSDPLDAIAIQRFATRESDSLRAYRPLRCELRRLRCLLLRRAKLVEARVKVRMSLRHLQGLETETETILASFDAALAKLDSAIEAQLASDEGYRRLRQIPGVGRLGAATLLSALERGVFRRADSFVSFLGLDPLPSDSGQKRGRRRLSKMGDAHARRMAFLAAMAACKTACWKPVYTKLRARLTTTEALVALSRRIVRTAWSMHTHRTNFDPARLPT